MKKSIWKQIISALLACLLPFMSCGTAFAQVIHEEKKMQTSAQDETASGNIPSRTSDSVQSIKLSSKSTLKDITEGDTLTIGQDGTATLTNSGAAQQTAAVSADPVQTETPQTEAPADSRTTGKSGEDQPVDLMGGQTIEAEVTESGDSTTITPDLSGSGLRYDEAAAAAVAGQENTEYMGNLEGTDLAAYKVTPNADAVPFDSTLEDEKLAELKQHMDADPLSAEEVDKAIVDSDAYGRAVAENLKDPQELEKLNTNTPTDAFRIEKPDSETVITIVDDNAFVLRVLDSKKDGINGAAVTIKFKDKNGNIVTKQDISRNSGGADGYVVFNEMAGIRSGYLNVEKDSFRINTELDADLDGGMFRELILTPTNENDVYVRCMDMEGSDLLNKSETLSLTKSKTAPFNVTVLLSSGKDISKIQDTSLSLKATNPKDTSRNHIIDSNSKGQVDSKTLKFTYSQDWAKYGAALKAEDVLSVVNTQNKDTVYLKSNLTVKNAIVDEPMYKDISLSILGGGAGFTIPESTPVVGGSKISADFLKLPITVIIGLDGTVMFSYNFDITTIVEKEAFLNTEYIPRKSGKTKSVLGYVKEMFNAKLKAYKAGKALINKKGPSSFLVDGSNSVKVNAMLTGVGSYDSSTGYINLDLSMMVAVEGKFDKTFYYIIPPPVYAGFEASASAGVMGGVGVKFKPPIPPNDISSLTTLETKNFEPIQSINFALGLSVYAGVGIRGLLCVEASGGVATGAEINFKENNKKPANKEYPRITSDIGFDVKVSAVALWFKAEKTLFSKSYNIYDSWGLGGKDPKLWVDNETSKTYEIVFDGMEEATVDRAPSTQTEGTLAPIPINPDKVVPEADATLTNVNGLNNGADGTEFKASTATSADSKVSYVSQDGITYAFRIAIVQYTPVVGYYYPTLVYQKEKPSGDGFEDKFYQVPYIGDNYYDYDFDVMVNEASPTQYAYLNIISGYRRNFYNQEDCAKQTISRVVMLDMNNNTVKKNEILQDKTSGSFKYSPSIYGYEDRFVAAWQESPSLAEAQSYKNQKIYTGQNYIHDGQYSPGETTVTFLSSTDNITEMVLNPGNDTQLKSSDPTYSTPNAVWLYFLSKDRSGQLLYRPIFHPRDYYAVNYTGTQLSSLQTLRNTLTGTPPMVVNDAGKLMVNEGPKWAAFDTIEKDSKGNTIPFKLPENAQVYAYCINAKMGYRKLVTVTKETVKNGDKTTINSILHIYNVEAKDGKYIIHGPKDIPIEGRNINQVMAMIYYKDGAPNNGLRLLYTADTQKKILSEPTINGNEPNGYSPGEVTEACSLYRWNEGDVVSAQVTAIATEKPFIKKSETSMKATVDYKNNGTVPIQSTSVKITDNNGDTVHTQTDPAVIYPGESNRIEMSFAPLKSWKPGGMRLVAAATATRKMIEGETEGEEVTLEVTNADMVSTPEMNDPALTIDGVDTLISMGNTEGIPEQKHYASLNITNESMVSAENIQLKVYKMNDGVRDDNAAASYPLDKLNETYAVGDDVIECSYNMGIPLQDYWNEDSCTGVVLVLTPPDNREFDLDPFSNELELSNPLQAGRNLVIAQPNDASYGSVEGDGAFKNGEAVTLKATAFTGYRFVEWQNTAGERVSGDAAYQFTMGNDPVSCIAVFEETGTHHKLTLFVENDADGDPLGVVDAIGGDPVFDPFGGRSFLIPHDQEITVSATAREGYLFNGWAELDKNNNEIGILSSDADYTIKVDHETRLMAKFARDVGYTVWLNAQTNGGTCAIDKLKTNEAGQIAEYPAATKDGYTFTGWYDAIEGGNAMTPDTVYSGNSVIYAQFAPLPDIEFTVTASAKEGGSINPSGQIKVKPDIDLSFTATPNTGYVLKGWIVDGQENSNKESTYTFSKISTNHTIEAVFEKQGGNAPKKQDNGKTPGTGLIVQNSMGALLALGLLIILIACLVKKQKDQK